MLQMTLLLLFKLSLPIETGIEIVFYKMEFA